MLSVARHLLRFRSLTLTLVGRELKARYRGSVLGFFWSLVNPLLLLGVYTFVFGWVFRSPQGKLADPYALFLVTGLFPWVWVSTSLLEGTVSLIANAGLIRKAVFPAEVLPTVSVIANLVHLLLAVPVIVGALVVGRRLGYPVAGWSSLLLPVVIGLQIPLVEGLALGLSAMNAHFKDVKDLLANVLTLMFFVTPILYPLEAVTIEWVRWPLEWLNPFTPFTLAYQEILFYGTFPPPELWLRMGGWTLGCWILGAALFARLEDTLVEAV